MAGSGNVLFVFLIYSTAMFILPLLTFFGVKNVLEKELDITGFTNTAWSVICAVIMANFIIMAYIWRAYKQELEDEKTEENMSLPVEETVALTKSDLDLKKDE